MERWPQYGIGLRWTWVWAVLETSLSNAPDHSGLTASGEALQLFDGNRAQNSSWIPALGWGKQHFTKPMLFFSLSFSEDGKEYNKIKQSKLAYEWFGLNRRNFQEDGGQALKCITSGILCHIIFWSVSQGWISICLRYVSNGMPRWY